jgi:N-acetylated-alpha-linked acidic dipeptidase
VMAAARAWAMATSEGMRPRRTLVFATWDAEEWGLVGSTEWVQLMRDSLKANAVAYYNQDESAAGRSFGAGGTASLQAMIREATKTVQMPGDTGSIYATWASGGRGRGTPAPTGTGANGGRRGRNGRGGAAPAPAPIPEPRMGDLGGGSDFAGFYNNLGIASIETGFGGRAGWYHSAYDTYTAMERFGDPGYLSHAAEGRLAAVILARLANADVIPYDFAALGSYLGVLANPAAGAPRIREPNLPRIATDLAPVVQAAAEFKVAGDRFNALRDTLLGKGGVSSGTLARTNSELRQVEQQLTRPTGLVGRPFMKNLIFASDRDNGYANIALPGISEALRDNDLERAKREIQDLTQRIRAATARVDAAAKAIERK